MSELFTSQPLTEKFANPCLHTTGVGKGSKEGGKEEE